VSSRRTFGKKNNTSLNNTYDQVFHEAIVTEPLESLGDSITTAVLLQWNKKTGDVVKEDDIIAVVETDKVFLI
jgi:hypothetical protein